jgi:hypothetical protein
MQAKTRHAIRTYLTSLEAVERMGYRRNRLAACYPWENPRVEELKRAAFKAMLFEYRGKNMHYKRQLRMAALGIPDGGTPPLWSI